MNSVERLDVHPRIITALKKGKILAEYVGFPFFKTSNELVDGKPAVNLVDSFKVLVSTLHS